MSDSPIRTLAGISADGRTIRILLSNPSDQTHVLRLRLANLPWSGAAEYHEQVVDERSNLEARGAPVTRADSTFSEAMARESVVLLTIRAAGGERAEINPKSAKNNEITAKPIRCGQLNRWPFFSQALLKRFDSRQLFRIGSKSDSCGMRDMLSASQIRSK
jgi:hypothetical protein